MLLEKESHIRNYIKQDGLRRAQMQELQQMKFLVKIRKSAVTKTLKEIQQKQTDHEDAVAILEYEISSKKEHLARVEKMLEGRKEELEVFIAKTTQEYNSKKLEWKAKDASVQDAEKSVEKLRHDLELKLESLNRDIKLHDILPALQRRVRKLQQDRLRLLERETT